MKKTESKKVRYTDEERALYLKLLKVEYPKTPEILLMDMIKVHELKEFGSPEIRRKTEEILDAIPKQPGLEYFGTNGFQVDIEENKGFTIKTNKNDINKITEI